MLYGEPGTGKTSTIKAICSELNAPMFIVPPHFNTEQILNNIHLLKSDLTHKNIVTNLPITRNKIKEQNYLSKPIVVVFEEFDKFFKLEPGSFMGGKMITEEDTGDKGYKLNTYILQEFLQFLDGINSPSNVIFVATTNHIDHIDPALLRKGRFDLKYEMNKISYDLAAEMIKDMCPHKEVSDYIIKGEEINSSELFTNLIFEQLKHK
jgi:SpoVK/Ycf46/Vps4 family AAA+-type ATPase